MLTKNELLAEIDKYESRRNLTPDDCVRLAAFYIILGNDYPVKKAQNYNISFSENPEPTDQAEQYITVDGDSEFLKAINGRYSSEIWPVIDELMQTLQVINPRLYAGVMRKIQD